MERSRRNCIVKLSIFKLTPKTLKIQLYSVLNYIMSINLKRVFPKSAFSTLGKGKINIKRGLYETTISVQCGILTCRYSQISVYFKSSISVSQTHFTCIGTIKKYFKSWRTTYIRMRQTIAQSVFYNT